MSLADRASATSPTEIERPTFSVGGVFHRSVAIFGWYLILAVLVAGSSFTAYVFVYFVGWDYVFPIKSVFPGMGDAAAQYFRLSVFFTALLQSLNIVLIVATAYQRFHGQKIRVGYIVGRALRRALPVTLIRFIPSFGMTVGILFAYSDSDWLLRALGFFVFALPSVFLDMILYIAPTINIVENRGVVGSWRRSAALTRGHRWKLFGIFLILSGPYLVVYSQISRLYYGYGIAAYIFAGHLLTGGFSALSSVVGVILYNDLRNIKDGVSNDRIATVFD